MYEFADEVSKQAHRTVVYNDVTATEYKAALLGFGLPQMIVDVVIDADLKSLNGDLDSSSRPVKARRHTTKVPEAIRAALASIVKQE